MPKFAVLSESPQFHQAKTTKRACQSPVSSEDEFDFEPRKRSKNAQQKPRVIKKVITAKVAKSKSKRLTSSSTGSNTRRADAQPSSSPKFVWYLMHCLKESVQSTMSFEYGFGQGSIVPLPNSSEWTSEQTSQFGEWLEALGFVSRPTVNSTVFRIANKDALSIVQRFSSQISSNPSNTQALLAQMKAPIEDDNLTFATATETPKKQRSGFDNYTRRAPPSSSITTTTTLRPISRRPPPPSSLMWGSPIPTVSSRPTYNHSRLSSSSSIDSIDLNNLPSSTRRLSICSIAEEELSQSSSHGSHNRSTHHDPKQLAGIDLDFSYSNDESEMVRRSSIDSLDLDAIHPTTTSAKRLSFGGADFFQVPPQLSSSRLSVHEESSSMDLLNVSRENVVVQSKKTRNHLRRLSRFDVVRSTDRRLSLFVAPKVAATMPQADKADHVVMPRHVASIVLAQPVDENAATLYENLPWGQYLSDGAYKQVFKSCLLGTKNHKKTRGLYQYIRMELCDGGNVEDYLRLDGTTNLVHGWPSLFFQMVYALYAGRVHHQLRHYDVKLTSPYWVKLADFGTADTDATTFGLPIGVEHKKHGRGTTESSFLVLQQQLSVSKDNEAVLCDTLYRLVVLFGLDQLDGASSVVSALLLQQLAPSPKKRHATPAQRQFEVDVSMYSVASGASGPIALARRRLQATPGAMDVFRSLVHFDPAQRPTMSSVLQSRMFEALTEDNSDGRAVATVAAYGGARLLDI
ncbi:hypothetical protein DYB37_010992 [Aphanomyces astaci]|uniref:Protein kinase domain-containing protein n=1 Tax=Aphanomyces astaci TaxID=112090 RepID=A0A418ETB4_APHAT|nr:hypothetical protein DYB35_008995 [Aphanomyces astaci]RHZ18604.1 hypothetical protein DYB37_010992 [Aphanomyces astaci]